MELCAELEFAKAFHGHLGPNLVIGMKMGEFAVRELQARRYFGIKAQVSCALEPPGSCIIDGIQVGAGCTMGKANVTHTPADGPARVVFTNTDTGRSISLAVVDGLAERAGLWMNELGEEKASLRVWELQDEAVFTIVSD